MQSNPGGGAVMSAVCTLCTSLTRVYTEARMYIIRATMNRRDRRPGRGAWVWRMVVDGWIGRSGGGGLQRRLMIDEQRAGGRERDRESASEPLTGHPPSHRGTLDAGAPVVGGSTAGRTVPATELHIPFQGPRGRRAFRVGFFWSRAFGSTRRPKTRVNRELAVTEGPFLSRRDPFYPGSPLRLPAYLFPG